jgi:type I restriction enzyme M protein
MSKKTLYKISEVAEMFGIHEDTLRNWEKDGLITPIRIGTRKDRRYSQKHIDEIVSKKLAQVVKILGEKEDEKEMDLTELKQFLWKSADILRGKIDSGDYKKYIFGLLFYKRMSDVWEETYKSILDEFQDADLASASHNHRFDVPKEARWSVVRETTSHIGQKLNEAFDLLTNANSPRLDKIFDDLDFANTDKFPNETLYELVNHFSQYDFGEQYFSSDVLGDAYEYLIEQFAADAGKKGGEFYTPREIERTIIQILKPHKKDHIYDPTAGSGGFLLEAFHHLEKHEDETAAKSLYLQGQEINLSTFAIAKINMFLHGLDSADIRRGDTLRNPKFLDESGDLKTFDIVVSNFPFSMKSWPYEIFADDPFGRSEGYTLPPKKNADYAFILHIIKSMNSNGRAGVVVPHGVLFKSDASGDIRKQILQNDFIEAVIAFPAKLFYGVSIPAATIIFNKNKPEERKGKVLIIDAEAEYEEGKKQNRLRNKDIEKIVKTFDEFKDVEKYARVVDIEEIEKNEWNLNIRRYVDISEEEVVIDVKDVVEDLKKLEYEREKIDVEVNKFLNQLGY